MEEDTFNLQVTITKSEHGNWKVKDFVVVYQPEPWDPQSFNEVLRQCCSDPHPTIFSWSSKTVIKVKVVVS